jgi:hypothetical protein
MLGNFEQDVAKALEDALRKASEPGETLPWGRLARRLAPSVANVVECLMPFAIDEFPKAPITTEMMVVRESMRREIEVSVIDAIRERVFVPPPPLPAAEETNPEAWDQWVRVSELAPGLWDMWVTADGEFYDLETTFRVSEKGGGPSRTPRRLRLGRGSWMRLAPSFWGRLWRRIAGRTTHQEL